MKYYLLNKQECEKNIWVNPVLVRTKSMVKIKKLKTLQKQIELLQKQITKELKESNKVFNEEIMEQFLNDSGEEISKQDYNYLYTLALYDTQTQRIKAYNKTDVMRGKAIGES